jgi:septal ring factor EnvC (AmiA/AmiB activator)
MKKQSILITAILFVATIVFAQPQTREELERQKQQLKRELKETEKMLSDNKAKTKENFLQWKLISDKVNLQDRLVENINSDINLLDRSLTNTQRDINKYDKLLDTLKQEYTKSMVYAYKNRSNYDFLNFIFSAANFNDAIKRIAYLKSYRNYREMQGQNIIRTQELRRQRVEELTGTKQKKTIVLQSKDQELSELEKQQKEKDRILDALKKQGGQLSSQYAAKNKQLKRVEGAIAANIKRAIEEAKKEAARLAAIKKASDDKAAADAKKAADKAKADAAKNNPTKTNPVTAPEKTPVIIKTRETRVVKTTESVLVTDENRATNTSFRANQGNLPWPVNGRILMHYGRNVLGSGTIGDYNNVTIATEIGAPVKAIFGGIVSFIMEDESVTVTIQHGGYFTTYSNLSNVSVKKGQQVALGQVLGKAMANMDGVGAVDFFLQDEHKYYDPEKWLHR